ncbi:hypothetical protein CEXT_627961 [Caerostris extrusa]|uniref:Uncharacterized protein n=1 Tax=Caerostris extrusa TaxID=172846 RepID=A0AAV4WGR9_CAEEX|nr:hypothetical protein CEXT_627961 [Caerostris extrusa]
MEFSSASEERQTQQTAKSRRDRQRCLWCDELHLSTSAPNAVMKSNLHCDCDLDKPHLAMSRGQGGGGSARTLKMSLAASLSSSRSRCDILTKENGIPMRPGEEKRDFHLLDSLFSLTCRLVCFFVVVVVVAIYCKAEIQTMLEDLENK